MPPPKWWYTVCQSCPRVRCFLYMHFSLIVDPPKILTSKATVFVVQGLSVQLQCTFDGLPVPSITWDFFNGTNTVPQFTYTNNLTTLTLSDLTGGNTGNYTCSASNFVGSSSDFIQLFVQGILLLESLD